MVGVIFLGVDIDFVWIEKRIVIWYIDKMIDSYEEVIVWVMLVKEKGEVVFIGFVGDIGDVLERFLVDGIVFDILID